MASLSQARLLGYCRLRSRDCSRLLASELDVKVSLHPAQASQRPCDGPVSSHTTCWLHDTPQTSMPLRGREHQCNQATVICHTFCVDSSVLLVPRHRREVCPLARRVMLPVRLAQPVSSPLPGGVRFFPPLYPHRIWSALWLSYLSRRSDTGLPRSARLTRTGEVLSLRRERWVSMTGYYRAPVPAPAPFWLKPLSLLGLLLITTFIERSPMFTIPPIQPRLHLRLAETPSPHSSGTSQ